MEHHTCLGGDSTCSRTQIWLFNNKIELEIAIVDETEAETTITHRNWEQIINENHSSEKITKDDVY